MTQLEELYNTRVEDLTLVELSNLIETLQKERDCWLFNAQQLQKQVNELEKEVKHLRLLYESTPLIRM